MKKFLDKYNTVIFDMDGVITSEQNYWNSAALTVREYLSSDRYFGKEKICPAEMNEAVKSIRNSVFNDDKLISSLKSRGVNSNWDLGYVTVLIALVLGTDDPEKMMEFAEGLSDNILDEYNSLAEKAAAAMDEPAEKFMRNGELWVAMRDCFQEWFLGDELFIEQYGRKPVNPGKPGLVNSEMPIIPMSDMKTLLSELSQTKRVCTGTGRPAAEILSPLKQWGVIDCFAKNGLSNYDHVAAAEARTKQNLTKPHPYMFLKALYGTDYDDDKLLCGQYDSSAIASTLIVGDAGADILAAKAMGADFCAVLTGVNGKAARGFFEDQGAEYILDSVADLI